MEGISSKEALGFAIERASALNGLWNLFIAVLTGVVGVMASGKQFTKSPFLKMSLSLVFLAFAWVNLHAMVALGDLRTALLGMLPSDLPNHAKIVESLSPYEAWQYSAFHLFLDAVVLAVIWLVPWPSSEK